MARHVRLRIAGDLMLGGSVLDRIEEHGPLFPFQNLLGQLKNADIFLATLECTLYHNDNPPIPEKILLHTNPNIIEGLEAAGINLLSLGNNHSFDYGLAAFERTKATLEKAGISCFGGGENIRKASEGVALVVNGISIAFLSYCAGDTGCRQFAAENQAGVSALRLPEALKDIRKAKDQADVVVVSLHWGEQFRDYPSPEHRRIARALIDEGVMIVAGSHAHVIQGYEEYKNGLILYDLGSLIFGDIVIHEPIRYEFLLEKRKHREGIVVDCRLTECGVEEIEFTPVLITSEFQASVPTSHRGKQILERFIAQSRKLSSPNYDGFYRGYLARLRIRQFLWNRVGERIERRLRRIRRSPRVGR